MKQAAQTKTTVVENKAPSQSNQQTAFVDHSSAAIAQRQRMGMLANSPQAAAQRERMATLQRFEDDEPAQAKLASPQTAQLKLEPAWSMPMTLRGKAVEATRATKVALANYVRDYDEVSPPALAANINMELLNKILIAIAEDGAVFAEGEAAEMAQQLLGDVNAELKAEMAKTSTKVAYERPAGDKGHDASAVAAGASDAERSSAKAKANQDFLDLQSPADHAAFDLFKGRMISLATQLDPSMAPTAEAEALKVWTQVCQAEKTQQTQNQVPMSNPAAGWMDMPAIRKDHENKGAQSILSSFAVVESTVKTALQNQFFYAKSFGFWSGPVAKAIVLGGGADVGLESSAIGGLFDGLNINGKWDGALWAGLSHMYAEAVVKHGRGKDVRVFCSPGAALENIYTAVEFPAMKVAFERGDINIFNYPCAPQIAWQAGKPSKDWVVQKPDPRINEGGVGGTYAPIPGGIPGRTAAVGVATNNLAARLTAEEQKH